MCSTAIPALPLHNLLAFSPFRIDALGLVTLIGAEEVNRTIGRLSSSKYTKFLPLLGAYLIASNQFTSNQSGYQLYNVSDAITTTAVSGWFTRWLDTQRLRVSSSAYEWRVREMKRERGWNSVMAVIIGAVCVNGLVLITVLMGDWWGLANALSMGASILVRWLLVQENVDGLDAAAVSQLQIGPKMKEKVKLLITLADGKMVTIVAPRGLVIAGFTRRIEPPRKLIYQWGTRAGWLFFGIHIIALGQSDLVSQLYTVMLLVLSTWATVHGVGSHDSSIGDWIVNEEMSGYTGGNDRRQTAYVKLNCTLEEEDSLMQWGLLPHKSNKGWWGEYEECKVRERGDKLRDSKDDDFVRIRIKEKSLSMLSTSTSSSTMSDESL